MNKTRSMRRMRKVLLMVACMALVAGLAIGGTVAWLVDTSSEVTNTFAVGDLEIELRENEITETGTLGTAWQTANTYSDIVPGDKVNKNPTIFVKEGSEPCYLFACVKNGVAVTNGTGADATYENVADFTPDSTCWTQIGGTYEAAEGVEWSLWALATDASTGTITDVTNNTEWVTTISGTDKYYQVSPALFSEVTIDGTAVTKSNIGTIGEDTIVVTAYVHQSTNTTFEVAKAAAEAWYKQLSGQATGA